jgi:hypothetical protein
LIFFDFDKVLLSIIKVKYRGAIWGCQGYFVGILLVYFVGYQKPVCPIDSSFKYPITGKVQNKT